jgi:hypothetical protein
MAEYIFKAFNPAEDVIGGKTKIKTFPIWTDSPTDVDTTGQGIMNVMWTSSLEIGTWESNYYYNIYNQDTISNINADPQFSIGFGTTQSVELDAISLGLGEEYAYSYPSKAVYSQFLSILEEKTISDPINGAFKIYPNINSTSLVNIEVAFIISAARARIKDRIELNTWQLMLSGSGGNSGSTMPLVNQTGSVAGAISVPIIIGDLNHFGGQSEFSMSNQISGSVGTQMGIFYPQRGVFILDAIKIYSYIGNGVPGYNPSNITGSLNYIPLASLNNFWEMLKNGTGIANESYFRARTTENVQSTHYFCRIKNYEYNYSTNPTWVSGSNNEILDEFYTEPRTFITTVGLYDGDSDSGQLVAVAKLSRPIPKDGESEALIKIRLDF